MKEFCNRYTLKNGYCKEPVKDRFLITTPFGQKVIIGLCEKHTKKEGVSYDKQ